ncbi:very-long-chain (3R)-3-hydroxyacyl-CoA dehydratase 2-like [Saccostrea echinata]|uniref:very-long-chain (3R)-3-hydroxyacyl-CoA dehydratase 2-like n=1 Tax=Saccostrea echinata TaxID=191078 RepID=UPI002A7F37F6|nr:very-long-chain (3R)-3-hydroxyacyl-CoA dehydratase 2-like [Saccostrea echinata]
MATKGEKKDPTQSPSAENGLSVAYLVAYNVLQMIGWTLLMFKLVYHMVTERTVVGLYDEVATFLNTFQTAAVLEILHCALGLVRSRVVLTAFQVFSRVFLTWAITYSVPSVQNYYGVLLFVTAWTVTEIIRYSFYFFSLLGGVPYFIVWCRYTFFIVLYPIGVTGELITVFSSLREVEEKKLYYLQLPNAANMSFNYFYFLIFFMIMYIPVFPQLYMHMLAQRRKVIGNIDKPKSQ